jgi:hypothetical protein
MAEQTGYARALTLVTKVKAGRCLPSWECLLFWLRLSQEASSQKCAVSTLRPGGNSTDTSRASAPSAACPANNFMGASEVHRKELRAELLGVTIGHQTGYISASRHPREIHASEQCGEKTRTRRPARRAPSDPCSWRSIRCRVSASSSSSQISGKLAWVAQMRGDS